ncbi:PE-PGRS family protein PE_PGRS16 [Mycobacterium simulans]|uniref:PE-PGRS family protein PE_PGRS16 n=1 Tax=Mycobacterium simulans TaxID=627089 RepID=A0A7Z7IQ65_9MYCO|nr:PE-PGRS family protein PE_PGRS16 [Mycobacterium simulans]
MSFVFAVPEFVDAAAAELSTIGAAISQANAAAALPTTPVVAAGGDEVSAAIAALFGSHAQEYQAISAQVTAFHDQFVRNLQAAVSSYAGTEAVNVEQQLLNAVNAPSQLLTGRPLIGDGANGTAPGPGPAATPGSWATVEPVGLAGMLARPPLLVPMALPEQAVVAATLG